MAKRKLLFGDQAVADQLEAPEVMPLDVARETMPQSALRQAMDNQANTDQIQPKADPENLDSAGAAKPSLFKPTTKQKWLGYDEPNFDKNGNPAPLDAYGLEKPQKHHEGYLSKIAGIGLPALIGLAGGVGLAPGLLTGFLGERGRESAMNRADAKDYNTSREAAYQADKLQKELDLKGKSEADLNDYRNKEIGLGYAKLEADKGEKEKKISDKTAEKRDNLTYAQSAVDKLDQALQKIPSAGSNLGNIYAQGVNKLSLGNSKYAEPLADVDFYGNILAGDISKQLFSRNTQFEFQKVLKDVIASQHGSAKERAQKIKDLKDFIQTKADLMDERNPGSIPVAPQAPQSKLRTTKSGLQYEVE